MCEKTILATLEELVEQLPRAPSDEKSSRDIFIKIIKGFPKGSKVRATALKDLEHFYVKFEEMLTKRRDSLTHEGKGRREPRFSALLSLPGECFLQSRNSPDEDLSNYLRAHLFGGISTDMLGDYVLKHFGAFQALMVDENCVLNKWSAAVVNKLLVPLSPIAEDCIGATGTVIALALLAQLCNEKSENCSIKFRNCISALAAESIPIFVEVLSCFASAITSFTENSTNSWRDKFMNGGSKVHAAILVLEQIYCGLIENKCPVLIQDEEAAITFLYVLCCKSIAFNETVSTRSCRTLFSVISSHMVAADPVIEWWTSSVFPDLNNRVSLGDGHKLRGREALIVKKVKSGAAQIDALVRWMCSDGLVRSALSLPKYVADRTAVGDETVDADADADTESENASDGGDIDPSSAADVQFTLDMRGDDSVVASLTAETASDDIKNVAKKRKTK